MATTFFDSFMPSVTGELGKLPGAYAQGQLQGEQAVKQLALMDAQIRQANAMAKFQEAHAQHYGQKMSPKMEAMTLLARENPMAYQQILQDPALFSQFFGGQNPYMSTGAGVFDKRTGSIIPDTAKPTKQSIPWSQEKRALALELFGIDPGIPGNVLDATQISKLMQEDEARRTRIMGGKETEALKAKEQSPLSMFDKDFIEKAKSMGLDPLNRAKPLTASQIASVRAAIEKEKEAAKEKPPKPLSMNEAGDFASALQAVRGVDTALAGIFDEKGNPKGQFTLAKMVGNVPGSKEREFYSAGVRAMGIMLKLRSGAAVTESEAKRAFDGYWPTMMDLTNPHNAYTKLQELRQFFADTIMLKDPEGYYRGQLEKSKPVAPPSPSPSPQSKVPSSPLTDKSQVGKGTAGKGWYASLTPEQQTRLEEQYQQFQQGKETEAGLYTFVLSIVGNDKQAQTIVDALVKKAKK